MCLARHVWVSDFPSLKPVSGPAWRSSALSLFSRPSSRKIMSSAPSKSLREQLAEFQAMVSSYTEKQTGLRDEAGAVLAKQHDAVTMHREQRREVEARKQQVVEAKIAADCATVDLKAADMIATRALGARPPTFISAGVCSSTSPEQEHRVALVTTARFDTAEEAPVLLQWLRYHWSVGFAKVYLFLDDPEDPAAAAIDWDATTATSSIRGGGGGGGDGDDDGDGDDNDRDGFDLREFVEVIRNDDALRDRQRAECSLFASLGGAASTDSILARQQLNCELAVRLAAAAAAASSSSAAEDDDDDDDDNDGGKSRGGYDWILHIDVDELFHIEQGDEVGGGKPDDITLRGCSRGSKHCRRSSVAGRFFAALADKGRCSSSGSGDGDGGGSTGCPAAVAFLNHEGVPEHAGEVASPFDEVSLFRVNPCALWSTQLGEGGARQGAAAGGPGGKSDDGACREGTTSLLNPHSPQQQQALGFWRHRYTACLRRPVSYHFAAYSNGKSAVRLPRSRSRRRRSRRPNLQILNPAAAPEAGESVLSTAAGPATTSTTKTFEASGKQEEEQEQEQQQEQDQEQGQEPQDLPLPMPVPNGVHRFRGQALDGDDCYVEPGQACILHYVNCFGPTKFQGKYSRLRGERPLTVMPKEEQGEDSGISGSVTPWFAAFPLYQAAFDVLQREAAAEAATEAATSSSSSSSSTAAAAAAAAVAAADASQLSPALAVLYRDFVTLSDQAEIARQLQAGVCIRRAVTVPPLHPSPMPKPQDQDHYQQVLAASASVAGVFDLE